MPDTTKEDQYGRLLGYISGNQASWLVDIGLQSGLFGAIAASDGGIGEGELARSLGFEPRYVGVWCRGAYAFKLVECDASSGYRLSAHMGSLLLDPSAPQFMGGRVQFGVALYEDYLAFPRYLRTGDVWPRSEHDPVIREALQNTTKPDCVMITKQVLPQAPETLQRLEAGGDILDIGAGAGHHLIHYATRFPEGRVVGLEPDEPSIELARGALAEVGLEGRVELRLGDANELDVEDVFDLVTMNITLHETDRWSDYENVLARVRRALRPGGTTVVAESPLPDALAAYRDRSVYQLYAGVQLHEALVGCGMITQGQLRELLVGAGFDDVRVAEQSIPTRFVMLAGKDTPS